MKNDNEEIDSQISQHDREKLLNNEKKRQKLKRNRNFNALILGCVVLWLVSIGLVLALKLYEKADAIQEISKEALLFVIILTFLILRYFTAMIRDDDPLVKSLIFSLPFLLVDMLIGRSKKNDSDATISLMYLKSIKRKNRRVKLLLLATSVSCVVLNYDLEIKEFLTYSYYPIIVFGFLLISEYLIEYRVRMGFFGNSSNEAYDILKFIVQNSRDIDFNDPDGGSRKTLLSEVTESSLEQSSNDNLGVV